MIFSESAIKRDVLGCDRIFIQHDNDNYFWVSNGFWMLRLHGDSPVFENLELPRDGESLTYHGADSPAGRTSGIRHGVSEISKGPDLKSVMPIYNEGTDQVTITNYLDDNGGVPARITYTSTHVSYLNEDYHRYLDYSVARDQLKVYQATQSGAYAVTLDDTIFGVIMPMLVHGRSLGRELMDVINVLRQQEEGKQAA